jgi:hypothetical protein
VRVTSGHNVADTRVGAGPVHIYAAPFSAGTQNIRLMRRNSGLINVDGEPIGLLLRQLNTMIEPDHRVRDPP